MNLNYAYMYVYLQATTERTVEKVVVVRLPSNGGGGVGGEVGQGEHRRAPLLYRHVQGGALLRAVHICIE